MKAWWRRLPIRSRLAILYVLSVAFVMTTLFFATFLALRDSLYETIDEEIATELRLTTASLGLDASGAIRAFPSRLSEQELIERENSLVEVWSGDGRTLVYPERASVPTRGVEPASCDGSSRIEAVRRDSERLYRVACRPFVIGEQKTFVRVAKPVSDVNRESWELTFIFLALLPIGLALSGATGYFMAGRSLAPIKAIIAKVGRIGGKDLSERLDVVNPHDELGQLAAEFNGMFGRLERAFADMQRFTSDASHELRTPLTAMQTVGEVALRANRGEEALRGALRSMLEEVTHMNRLVTSLLTLSRADGGRFELRTETVLLEELLAEVGSQLRAVMTAKRQTYQIEVPSGLSVVADPLILRQALVNLVDNASKYGPEAGAIVVKARAMPSEIVIEVLDEGPGIPAEALMHVFERFYRVDYGRNRKVGGFGLGLAIVAWAIEAHGGSVAAENRAEGGAAFQIRLPRSHNDDR